MRRTSVLGQVLLYGGLAGWLLLASLPIVWAAVLSFRQYVDAFSAPLKWVAPFTFENYTGLWIDKAFYLNFTNTMLVTAGTVVISLSTGCLAGYALARYRGALGFWLLIIALVFRALPHSTLLPSFFTLFDGMRERTLGRRSRSPLRIDSSAARAASGSTRSRSSRQPIPNARKPGRIGSRRCRRGVTWRRCTSILARRRRKTGRRSSVRTSSWGRWRCRAAGPKVMVR